MIAEAIKIRLSERIIGLKISALLETALYCTLFTLYDVTFGNGDRFFTSAIHPFYFIIILVTVQYGTLEGIAATAIATLFLFSGDIPRQQVDESLFEYQFTLSINPLIWFATAFILGEMRMRLEQQVEEYKKEVKNLTKQRDVISSEYSLLKENKENLEAFVVGQQHSLAKTYKALKSLETLRPAQLLSNVEQIVLSALRVEKFSIFASGNNGFEVVRTHNWQHKEQLKHRITKDEELYKQVYCEKKVLCIINEEEEKTLANQGLLTGPLINQEKNEVFGMLKIEKMHFMELNISTIETFKGVCEIIGMAYSNALRYKEMKSTSLYSVEYPELFSIHLYREQRNLLKLILNKSNSPFTELLLTFGGKCSWNVGKAVIANLSKLILKQLPATAQSFLGNRLTGNIIVLLPSTSPDDATALARQLQQKAKKEMLLHTLSLSINVVDIVEEREIARIDDE